MAARLLAHRLRSHLHCPSTAATSFLRHSTPPISERSLLRHSTPPIPETSLLRLLSTAVRRSPRRPLKKPTVDIGARARKMQSRRLWSYGLAFAAMSGLMVVVLNTFQDSLVFYLTPTEAIDQYLENPSNSKVRLGGLILEGSVAHPSSTPEIEFIVTDLITDLLVRFDGALPDLFREGHSAVVEGFVKPMTDEVRLDVPAAANVSEKARSRECYFVATEVLAKHDEKYMPQEVAAAIAKNRKILAAASAAEEASSSAAAS